MNSIFRLLPLLCLGLLCCDDRKEAAKATEPPAFALIREAENTSRDFDTARREFSQALGRDSKSGEPLVEGDTLTASSRKAYNASNAAQDKYLAANKALYREGWTPYEKQQIIAHRERHALRNSIHQMENIVLRPQPQELADLKARLRQLESDWRMESEGEKWREHFKPAE